MYTTPEVANNFLNMVNTPGFDGSVDVPSEAVQSLSYGEKAVGLNFNPSNDLNVQTVKEAYASIINILNASRSETESAEEKRLYSIAITEAQTAQMWAVKAITWRD